MIRVNFNAYNNYVTDSLHQWDKNQDLSIHGLNLEAPPEIHFANVTMDRAIVKQSELVGGVVKVRIPNTLLQIALPIMAYIGRYEDQTFTVIETVEVPVIAKPRPTDYVFEDTDGEVYSYNRLENRMNAIIAGNSGQPNNAELVDVRIGADEHVYTTAGEAVRTQISQLTGRVDGLNAGGLEISDELINNKVDTWLNEHPEAISTVLDGSISTDKLADGSVTTDKLSDGVVTMDKLSLDLRQISRYDCVTPEQFGAVGDGVTDDSAAFVAASTSDKPLLVSQKYRVTNIALPAIVYGYGQIEGNVDVTINDSDIEGIKIKGRVSLSAGNLQFMNCNFTEGEVIINNGGHRFTNCSFSSTPITFQLESESEVVTNFYNCIFSTADTLFKGSPQNLVVTGGQIKSCTNVFNLRNAQDVKEVTVANCYITDCTNLIRCENDVNAKAIFFSACRITNNGLPTVVLNTDDCTTNTNYVSVKFSDCSIENFRAYTTIKNIECCLQGLPSYVFPQDGEQQVYLQDAYVSRHPREPLNLYKIPESWIHRGVGEDEHMYAVMFPEPIFVGQVVSDVGRVGVDFWQNGKILVAFSTGENVNRITMNATCYGFRVHSPSKVPTINITTSAFLF